MKKTICHITTVHPERDVRIFYKECKSLAKHGFDVKLIVINGNNFTEDGVEVIGVPCNYSGRLQRFLKAPKAAYRKALQIDAAIYHFHDPEFIRFGLLLKLRGKKVIFDIHENISKQINLKDWLPFRKLFSKLYSIIDFFTSKTFYIILAEKSYATIYNKYTKNFSIILNMPEDGLLKKHIRTNRSNLENNLFYIGGVSKERGIFQILKALNELQKRKVEFYFHCIGPIEDKTKDEIIKDENYKKIASKIKFYGALDINEGIKLTYDCKIGLSVLEPVENYLDSYSTKIFEYMSIGLPVISSNFPLWKEVVEENNCGICVDPLNTEEIANAIYYLFNNPKEAHKMSKNGLQAVNEKYNWREEEEKLIKVYDL
ncbi:MAG: hypothetical protein DRJ10_03975, partial [Bacteroidetes bacterium]